MKTPLLYQLSEFDCGPITLYNALKYLFDRDEISYEVIKEIMNITLDKKEKGTSKEAMKKSSLSLKKYLPLNVLIYEGNAVTPEIIRENNDPKTVFILRTKLCCEHYVLITKMDDIFAYIFDPYYLEEDYYTTDNDVAIVLHETFSHNRLVKIERLFDEDKKDFSLLEKDKRSIIVLKR